MLCNVRCAWLWPRQYEEAVLLAKRNVRSGEVNAHLKDFVKNRTPRTQQKLPESLSAQRGGDFAFESMNTGILQHKWPLVLYD